MTEYRIILEDIYRKMRNVMPPYSIFNAPARAGVQFDVWWRVYDTLPAEIRAEWAPGKMASFWKFYRTPLGRIFDIARGLKQKLG